MKKHFDWDEAYPVWYLCEANDSWLPLEADFTEEELAAIQKAEDLYWEAQEIFIKKAEALGIDPRHPDRKRKDEEKNGSGIPS